MNINLNHLRLFHYVARFRSFTIAAEKLFLTQPGISKQVRDLEQYYSTRLFERFGKKIELTQTGQMVFETTRAIFENLDTLQQKIDDFNNGITGNIIINSGYTPGIHVLPHIILDFKKLHQNINIHYDISTSREIFRKLQNNTIDIGITAMATKQNMESVSFLSDQLVLVLPVHHHLTMKKSIQVRDLSGEKLLSTKKGSATRILIDELTEKYNISPEIIEIGSPFAIVKAIESGNGITFMSKFAIQKEGNPKLIVVKNIEGLKFERSFYITYRTDKYQSKALKTFIDFFLKQYKT